MHDSVLREQLSQEHIVSLLADASITDSTRELTQVLGRGLSDLVAIPSCFVAWTTLELNGNLTLTALGNSERLFAEFYVGGASTVFSDDSVHKYRALIDTAYSKAQIRRQGRVPKYDYRYGIEHYGVVRQAECPIGMYIDPYSLLILFRFHARNSSDLYITRQPWVPQFIVCDTILNMMVIPMGIARDKVINYFMLCVNSVIQTSEKSEEIADKIREAVNAF